LAEIAKLNTKIAELCACKHLISALAVVDLRESVMAGKAHLQAPCRFGGTKTFRRRFCYSANQFSVLYKVAQSLVLQCRDILSCYRSNFLVIFILKMHIFYYFSQSTRNIPLQFIFIKAPYEQIKRCIRATNK